MTDKEKAIIMAHTGRCMLTGDKFQIFHEYIEDIMGRPIMTHEIGFLEDEIKEKSKADFIALCTDESEDTKEKQIQALQSKQLIDELSKMSPMVIETAYLHAINYTLFGVDVTEKWETATQNASALEKAYREGYYDALQRRKESEVSK